MDREKLRIIAGFAAVGLLVLVVPALRWAVGEQPTATQLTGFAPMPLNPVGQFRGVWLQLHNNDPGCPFEQYIREIASTGANAVCLTVAAEQENGSSSTMYIDSRKIPSDERLAGMFKLAKQLKMRIVFMPIVLLSDPVASEWRGQINPSDWSKWWASYSDYVLKYARLCEEHGVDAFIVGSELLTTERQESQWRRLIGQIRDLGDQTADVRFRNHLRALKPDWSAEDFKTRLGIDDLDAFAVSTFDASKAAGELGELVTAFQAAGPMLLSYSANWDHYKIPKFWDALDAVGMTTYHDLNRLRTADPSAESLAAAWTPIKAEILQWQAKVKKPIFFTEVGWPSQDGCSYEPWNYYRSQTVDLVEQQRCTQSFLDTFGHEPWVGGVLVWKWRDHPGMTGTLDATDAGRLNYTPFGKPVMKTLQAFFASPNPTADASAAVASDK